MRKENGMRTTRESSNIEDRFPNISSFHPWVWEKVDQQTQIYFKPQERGTRFHYLLCMGALWLSEFTHVARLLQWLPFLSAPYSWLLLWPDFSICDPFLFKPIMEVVRKKCWRYWHAYIILLGPVRMPMMNIWLGSCFCILRNKSDANNNYIVIIDDYILYLQILI